MRLSTFRENFLNLTVVISWWNRNSVWHWIFNIFSILWITLFIFQTVGRVTALLLRLVPLKRHGLKVLHVFLIYFLGLVHLTYVFVELFQRWQLFLNNLIDLRVIFTVRFTIIHNLFFRHHAWAFGVLLLGYDAFEFVFDLDLPPLFQRYWISNLIEAFSLFS